ncbi:MAG: IS200/IS605 family element transposase accessory protein TnpB [Rubrivivax sp.]|nr:IS200/IS605 family element transposase accessory protein TnpB [Pyrinomonadaceae bacterium]
MYKIGSVKAYRYKLRPSKRITQVFEETLNVCRELYNGALQERRDAWRINRVSLNYHDQRAQLPEIKLIRPDLNALYSQVPQDVLRRLSKTFDAFFRRVKQGQIPGFPRFKGKSRYNSFTYPQSGFSLSGDKLTLSKIGSVRLRLSRPIEGKIKICTIRREADGWFVIFTVEENQCRYFPKTNDTCGNDTCGIDVGIENFATFSTGAIIENPQYLRRALTQMKIQHRKASKKKRGGSNRGKAARILAKTHLHVAQQRKDFFHKRSLDLIREFDEIAVEELNIRGMVKNHHLAKSISDAAWGSFVLILTSKAENAGRRVWRVPPQFTSQDCSKCGERVKKSLSMREHRCPGCGYLAHRDVNAAQNIKARIAPFARVKVTSPDDQRIPVHL